MMILFKRSFACLFLATVMLSCQPKTKNTQEEQITIGTSTKTEENAGEVLFNGKGRCFSCHKANRRSIGPSITEIITVYAEKEGDLIAFLKQQQEPIVDPENYAVMKTNFAILKTFSDQELQALTAYMHQIAQP